MVLTRMLVATILAIAIGSSFQFGFQIGVINNVFADLKEFMCKCLMKRNPNFICYESKKEYVTLIRVVSSLFQSIFPVGAMFGSVTSGALADKFGRKKGLIIMAVPSIIGSIVMSCSKFINSFEAIIIGRFVIGYACGGYSCIAPTYLSEIGTLSIKGALGTINQLAIVIAIFMSQIFGLKSVLGGDSWNYLLGLSLIPTIIQLLILPFCPDSPRYLMINKGDENLTREALSSLRSGNFDDEIDDMKKDMLHNASMKPMSILDIWKQPHLRLGLLIAVGMQLSQQFTGINAVMFYSTEIFSKNLHLTTEKAQYASLGPSTVNICLTVVSVVIIERAGRKTLHLVGLIGVLISLLIFIGSLFLLQNITAFTYIAIIALCLFVASFAVGPGPIPWFMAAELFRENSRGAAVSASGFTNWLSTIFVGQIYPELQKSLGFLSLLPFICLTFLFIIFTFFLVPETKGRSSAELEDELKTRVSGWGFAHTDAEATDAETADKESAVVEAADADNESRTLLIKED